MYGLINRALRDWVRSSHGEEAWERVSKRAGADESLFNAMQSYPDEVTYGFVGAVADELQLANDEILHAFGRFWVLDTAKVHYGAIFEFGGRDLLSFLNNLDAMHEQVAISFANLRQPSFEVEQSQEGSTLLHYHSHRAGLASFVLGLLDGLSEHFGEPIAVEHVESKSDGADHDVFRVRKV